MFGGLGGGRLSPRCPPRPCISKPTLQQGGGICRAILCQRGFILEADRGYLLGRSVPRGVGVGDPPTNPYLTLGVPRAAMKASNPGIMCIYMWGTRVQKGVNYDGRSGVPPRQVRFLHPDQLCYKGAGPRRKKSLNNAAPGLHLVLPTRYKIAFTCLAHGYKRG